MSFLEDISQTIVENANKIIDYPISIMNDKGFIIGSTDLSRLGKFNNVSMEVLKKKETVYFEVEDVQQFENTFPGVAVPIIINEKALGVLGIIGNPREVEKYAQLLKSHVELMCHEYLKKEENELESKALHNFIHYLLTSTDKENLKQIKRYGRILGLDLNENIRRTIYLIEISNLSEDRMQSSPWEILQNNILNIVKSHLSDSKNDMISFLNLDQFIIVKAVNPNETSEFFMNTMNYKIKKLMESLKFNYDLEIHISIGRIAQGVDGIRQSYNDALDALNAGKKMNISKDVFHYNNLDIILTSLSNNLSPFIVDRVSHKIDRFINHNSFDTLSNTFLNYCKYNMNLSKTARKLFIHRNSLVYRLEKINELTSFDTANFEHCLLLYILINNYKYKDINNINK